MIKLLYYIFHKKASENFVIFTIKFIYFFGLLTYIEKYDSIFK